MTTRTYRSSMQVDVPTPRNELVIPQAVMEAAIETYLEADALVGMLEQSPVDDENFDLIMDRISHLVDNLYIDADGYLCATVTFLDTPQGNIGEMVIDQLQLTPVLYVIPDWDDHKAITNVDVKHINLRPRDELMEEGSS